jgi:hypothetical protein
MSRSNEFKEQGFARADAASRTRSSETWRHLFPALSSRSPWSLLVPCRGARLNEVLEVAGLIPHDQPVGPLG